MGYRDHIVAKLSALAVAGGTTAMLFAATPVHTQFSATTNGSLNASGATVSQTLTDGNLVASELVPSAAGTTAAGTTTAGGYTWTNPETVTLDNTGSVSEDFTLNISSVFDRAFAGNQQALEQLWVEYTVGGTTYYYQIFSGNNLPSNQATESSTGYTLGKPVTFALGTVPSQTITTATVAFALAPYTAGSGEGGANAWNGAHIDIPYTITAEPSKQSAQPQGETPKLTAGGSSTGAP
ncbi:hypothetical protein [Ferrimicrobium sp.]|uniref:hypothetical protein n=1 Tax=Ferrimicrobium sp. TaxID=2926050 RepID=UPI00260D067B|nr:hypothetical protein [Ferrimicrobium sp.]